MKKGKKPKKRKRGVASRKRKNRIILRDRMQERIAEEIGRRQHRIKELEEETQDIFDKVIQKIYFIFCRNE